MPCIYARHIYALGAAAPPGKFTIRGWVAGGSQVARAPLDNSRENKKEKREKDTIGRFQPPSSMRPGISYSVRVPLCLITNMYTPRSGIRERGRYPQYIPNKNPKKRSKCRKIDTKQLLQGAPIIFLGPEIFVEK